MRLSQFAPARYALVLATVLCTLAIAPRLAQAQYYPQQNPEPAPAPQAARPASKMAVDVGLFYGLAKGDLGDAGVNNSPGLAAEFHYTVIPHLSVLGGLRLFSLDVDTGSGSIYEVLVGGRYTAQVAPKIDVTAQAELVYGKAKSEVGSFEASDSAIGFGVGAGGAYWVAPKIAVFSTATYSSESFDLVGFKVDATWIALEAGARFAF